MEVLFLSTGTHDPATRFRFLQFFPHFERAGISCTLRGGYGRLYNELQHTPVANMYKLACRLKRAAQTMIGAFGYDLLVLQRTALPQTALPEVLASHFSAPMILDVDDAVFLAPDGTRDALKARAFRDMVSASAHVIAGNAYLAASAAAAEKTTVIPTVVDTDVFVPPAQRNNGARFTIGWSGTPGHFEYFPMFVPALRRILHENPHVTFRMVTTAPYADLVDHPQVEQITWAPETEVSWMQTFDVGVMPMPDTPWTRGKCALKLIQYLAVGAAGLASAVGANADVLDGSDGGILVGYEPDAWYAALRRVVGDPALAHRMGEAGRKRAVESYSVASVADKYVRLFQTLAPAA